MYSTPRMLMGAFPFEGAGLEVLRPVHEELSYVVPEGRRAQFVYFRGGNSSDELIYAALLRDGEPMRLFPIGAKSGCHVPLAVIEDLLPGTRLEIFLGAPHGVSGIFVTDVGFVETEE